MRYTANDVGVWFDGKLLAVSGRPIKEHRPRIHCTVRREECGDFVRITMWAMIEDNRYEMRRRVSRLTLMRCGLKPHRLLLLEARAARLWLMADLL